MDTYFHIEIRRYRVFTGCHQYFLWLNLHFYYIVQALTRREHHNQQQRLSLSVALLTSSELVLGVEYREANRSEGKKADKNLRAVEETAPRSRR